MSWLTTVLSVSDQWWALSLAWGSKSRARRWWWESPRAWDALRQAAKAIGLDTYRGVDLIDRALGKGGIKSCELQFGCCWWWWVDELFLQGFIQLVQILNMIAYASCMPFLNNWFNIIIGKLSPVIDTVVWRMWYLKRDTWGWSRAALDPDSSLFFSTPSREISALIGRPPGRNRFRTMCHRNLLDAAYTIQFVINSTLKDLHKFALFWNNSREVFWVFSHMP